jgi:hypothetical protein
MLAPLAADQRAQLRGLLVALNEGVACDAPGAGDEG